MLRLEGLGQLKNPMTAGIEPATFRLVCRILPQPSTLPRSVKEEPRVLPDGRICAFHLKHDHPSRQDARKESLSYDLCAKAWKNSKIGYSCTSGDFYVRFHGISRLVCRSGSTGTPENMGGVGNMGATESVLLSCTKFAALKNFKRDPLKNFIRGFELPALQSSCCSSTSRISVKLRVYIFGKSG
jgi:hypothetical protein